VKVRVAGRYDFLLWYADTSLGRATVMAAEVEEVYAMNAISDPVLAELWNNEKDAEYDQI